MDESNSHRRSRQVRAIEVRLYHEILAKPVDAMTPYRSLHVFTVKPHWYSGFNVHSFKSLIIAVAQLQNPIWRHPMNLLVLSINTNRKAAVWQHFGLMKRPGKFKLDENTSVYLSNSAATSGGSTNPRNSLGRYHPTSLSKFQMKNRPPTSTTTTTTTPEFLCWNLGGFLIIIYLTVAALHTCF